MKRAIQVVLDRKISETEAAERYEVPRTSLQERVKSVKQGQKIILKPTLGRLHQTFSPEYEKQLCQHFIDLHNGLMPLTISKFLRFAYDLTEKVVPTVGLIRKRGCQGKTSFWLSRREIQIWRCELLRRQA